jgi:hypothetical protein
LPTKGNPHLRIRVDPVVKRFLRGYAVAHDTTSAGLVREVLAEWVAERVDPTPSKRVDHTLHRLSGLLMRLELKVASLPGNGEQGHHPDLVRIASTDDVKVLDKDGKIHAVRKPPPPPAQPRLDPQKEREALYWIVVGMLKETQKLSESEELAKKAEARMGAMMTHGNLTRIGEALLEGYEKSYIQPMVDELVKLIEDLKTQLKQANQTGQENTSTGTTSTEP